MVEDQYVDDPYDPANFKIIEEEDETMEVQDEPPSFNMLSFIDTTEEETILQLVSGHTDGSKFAPKLESCSNISGLNS